MTTIDTTRLAWEFCSGHARANAPVLELVQPKKSSDDSRVVPEENRQPASDTAAGSAGTPFDCLKWAVAPTVMLLLLLLLAF